MWRLDVQSDDYRVPAFPFHVRPTLRKGGSPECTLHDSRSSCVVVRGASVRRTFPIRGSR